MHLCTEGRRNLEKVSFEQSGKVPLSCPTRLTIAVLIQDALTLDRQTS